MPAIIAHGRDQHDLLPETRRQGPERIDPHQGIGVTQQVVYPEKGMSCAPVTPLDGQARPVAPVLFKKRQIISPAPGRPNKRINNNRQGRQNQDDQGADRKFYPHFVFPLWLGQVHQFGHTVDGPVDIGVIVNDNGNGLPGADRRAPAASPAPVLVYDRFFPLKGNGVDKADIRGTCSATHTLIGHRHVNPLHAEHLGSDGRGNDRQHLPQAATGAAVADGHQPLRRAHVQPDRVQLVATDQVDQPGFPAAPGVIQGFGHGYRPAEPGVDVTGRRPQKNTPIFNRIVLAMGRIPADAKIHDPVKGGLFYKMFHHLRGHGYAFRLLNRPVDGNDVVFGQIDDFITFEKQTLHQPAGGLEMRQPGQEKPAGKGLVDQGLDPVRTAHQYLSDAGTETDAGFQVLIKRSGLYSM